MYVYTYSVGVEVHRIGVAINPHETPAEPVSSWFDTRAIRIHQFVKAVGLLGSTGRVGGLGCGQENGVGSLLRGR